MCIRDRFFASPSIYGIVNAGHQLKKVCSSDVMHCQISIFEIKLMVKIGVIFIPFSNPEGHLPSAANLGKLAHISEMAYRIWKWHDNDTYFHHHLYLKNDNLTVHYITGTYFFSQWPELNVWDIVRYVLKLWRAWANWRYQKFLNIFDFPTFYGYT